MSTLPIVIRLEQFADFSHVNLGDRADELSWLRQFVPVPPTLLVPTDTLERILISDHKVLQLKQLLENDQFSLSIKQRRVADFFAHLLLPQAFISIIHSEYREYFSNTSVRLFSAHSKLGTTQNEVRGEVNVLIAIKTIWCELVLRALKPKTTAPALAPANILIQSIPTARLTGHIASHHLGGIHKSALVVQAQNTTKQKSGEIEHYQVDVRSLAVIIRPELTHQLRITQKSSLSLLSDSECRQLATLTSPIIRQKLHPFVLCWCLTKSGFLFYDPLHPSETQERNLAETPQIVSATKVYATSSSISRMAAAIPLVDGVGPISARFLVHGSGLHPIGALRQKSTQTVLKHNIRRALFELVSIKRDLTIFYSFYNAVATQRAKLQLSESEQTLDDDAKEISGAEFLLTFPQWFDFELNTLAEFLKQTPVNLEIIIPEIKTPEEIVLVRKQLNKSGLHKQSSVRLWLEIASPAVVQSLHLFPLDGIAGLVLNLNELLPRMLCVKPAMLKDDNRQQLATAVAQDVCTTLSRQLMHHFDSQSISVVVQIPTVEKALLRKIVSLGWQGVCVQPDQIIEARSEIQTAERLVIDHKL